jgi:hypothetical protein
MAPGDWVCFVIRTPDRLANAVTRTAEDAADYDRATALEAAGGRVLELPAADWRAIAA